MDPRIRTLADRQHGLAARRQLLAAGMDPEAIRRAARRGLLIGVHRGVYRVGHAAPSLEVRYLAAVLACGEGALLCGRAAAYLWGLLRGRPPAPEVLARSDVRPRGVRRVRARRVDARDAGRCRGIPATTVPRTLVDLAATATDDELSRACHEAWVRYRCGPREVDAVLARRPTAAGAARLRAMLHGDGVALSRLERRFLELLRDDGLAAPGVNRRVDGRYVDCRWDAPPLTVELDSYAFHATRRAWEVGHRRAREAYARGDEFRSYTWSDVFDDPRLMLGELRALLPARDR